MAKFQKKTVVEVVHDAPDEATESSASIERDRIAERAYELYISRGRQDGRELEDWLAAERELTAHGRDKTRSSRRAIGSEHLAAKRHVAFRYEQALRRRLVGNSQRQNLRHEWADLSRWKVDDRNDELTYELGRLVVSSQLR